ncbi:MAG: hypothetical protein HQL37_08100 [Alphaproteobacteria bacterium]|nr:hypothetical protein [Alphaproteobacteria bacterium]
MECLVWFNQASGELGIVITGDLIMSEPTTPSTETPVARSYRKLVALQRPEYGLTDDARAARCDSIAEATTVLMRHPAETLDDIVSKLAVLCDRLRAEGDVVSETGRLTLLIAESARADAARLAIQAAGSQAFGTSAS